MYKYLDERNLFYGRHLCPFIISRYIKIIETNGILKFNKTKLMERKINLICQINDVDYSINGLQVVNVSRLFFNVFIS